MQLCLTPVQQSESPYTVQQRLMPTSAPSHFLDGFVCDHKRLGSEGLALNAASLISCVSSTCSIPSGRSAATAPLELATGTQQAQVSPPLTSRFHHNDSSLSLLGAITSKSLGMV